MTQKIIQPEGWPRPLGYANGVLTENGTLYMAGQVGWNRNQRFESDDFIDQMEQALRNIIEIVEAAGGTAENVTRLTWFVTDKAEYMSRQREVGAAYRRIFGKHFPAMSLVVIKELVEDGALLEIEATAQL